MPKKFSGENTKAVEARARKAAAATAANENKKAAEEEAYWKDEDKSVAKKQQRKEEQELKRQQALAAKNERKALESAEQETLVREVRGKVTNKMTQSIIQEEMEKREAAARGKSEKQKPVTHVTEPLEENVNRLAVEGLEARSITEAISILSVSSTIEEDKHPEKRVKAAYAAFEEKRLPILRQENPNMRLSQVKQMLQKEWRSSPENPLNQRVAALNKK